MNKNTPNKKLLKKIILIIILIVLFSIYKYNTYCLIYYVENEPPAGTTTWNAAVTKRIKVLNNGTLIYFNDFEKKKLEEDELKEIRQLVSQLKEKVKELEQDNSATDRFTINNKTYAVNSLDSEGEEIILKIRNIIY